MGRGRFPSTNSGSFFFVLERILERLRARLLAEGARRIVDIETKPLDSTFERSLAPHVGTSHGPATRTISGAAAGVVTAAGVTSYFINRNVESELRNLTAGWGIGKCQSGPLWLRLP